MTLPNLAFAPMLALNFDQGAVPEWIQLLPEGRQITGIDGRSWSIADAGEIKDTFERRGNKLPVDVEHATQIKGAAGEAAPAMGFITAMETRDTGLWGQVAWNAAGRALLETGSYAHISPVFTFSRPDMSVKRMVSAALTNNPNLDLVALNRAMATDPTKETPDMDKAVLEALGLNTDASTADAVVAITKLKGARDTALNSAKTPDPDKFVPKADHELALNRVKEFEKDATTRADADIEAAIDLATEAGKIAPASREYHLASCRAEGGLVRFQAMVRELPEIAANRPKPKDVPVPGAGTLSADEMAICTATGMDPEVFAKGKAAQEKSQ